MRGIWPFRRRKRVERKFGDARDLDNTRTTTARIAPQKPATPPSGRSGTSTASDDAPAPEPG